MPCSRALTHILRLDGSLTLQNQAEVPMTRPVRQLMAMSPQLPAWTSRT